MKNILSILLISVSFIGCSEKVQRYHVDETTSPNDKLTYLKKDMSLVSGIVFDTVYNGQLIDESNYKYGKKDGLSKSWYENGQLADEGNYKDGKEDGLFKSWYKNGQLYFEINYKYGKANGLCKFYYANGQLSFEKNYKDGKEDGLFKFWYENGQLADEGNFIDGKLILGKCWDNEGNEIECEN